ncbi:TSUP family transporter [Nocardioides sp. LHG3406-4]|uniref:TSUP family transporter n=1 Tax=Nocardioides sp. LHG3406-4 TaxID=2804575 RepID=UPI003CFA046D
MNDIAGVSLGVVIALAVVVALGAFVQSVAGLGLGLLGAPVVALLAPSLMPTLLLWLAVPMSLFVLVAEWRHVNWWATAWALPARVPGTVLGVWLVTVFTDRVLGIVVAVMVLVAVALAYRVVEVRFTPARLFLVGFAAGTSGTATSIGGPPMAILFAHRSPQESRATLSMFFFAGTAMSVALFSATGEMPAASVWLTLWFMPILVGSFLVGLKVRGRIPREGFRRLVLVVCTASALFLLARSLV